VKLRRLHIARLPGIDEPYTLEDVGDGFLLVVGPNGIGKSSLCRATRALLWAEGGAAAQVNVSALFEHEGERWSVERDGLRHRWQKNGLDSEPPRLPAAHLRRSFFLGLRDLLDVSSDAGHDVAARIRREMSGGFDLDDVAGQEFSAGGPRFGRSERNALDKRDREARQAGQRQEELGRDEARLEALEARVVAAAKAERRRTIYERALELHALRDQQLQAETEIEALPVALGRLVGRELEQLAEHESDLQEKRNQQRLRSEELNAARDEESSAELEEPLDQALLEAWHGRADRLVALEADLERANEEWQVRQGVAAEAGRPLGAYGDALPDIDLAGGRDLFVFLREARKEETRREAIDERLSLLADRQMSAEDNQLLTRLRLGVEPLRAWLRAPEPSGGSIAARPRWQVLLFVACVVIAMGAALWALVHSAFAALAGLGVGLAALGWSLRPDFIAAQAREVARRSYPGDLEAPAEWTLGAVTARLRALEGQITDLEATAKRSRDRDVERQNLANQRAAEESPELEERRSELAKQLGLDEIPLDAELVDAARALDQLRRTREEESGAGRRVSQIEEAIRTKLSELGSFLAGHGEIAPTDAASARAGIRKLANRDQALRAARAKQASARQAIREIDEDIAGIEGAISGIYEQAALEPGDRVGLGQLIERLGHYGGLRRQSDGLATSIKLARTSLESAGEADLVERDAAQLEQEQRDLVALARELPDLTNEVAEIRAEVKQAREGHALEEILDSRAAALAHLRERQDEALRASAGRFLIDSVKREHETIQMPEVLKRARKLFATFTHDAYELRVAPEEHGSFVAIETRTGTGKRPDELSDGTRAQLLLAAQLAFGEEVERGARLPLFLDEALDHSDPERFHAIAKSLGRMVKDEDRQILYLTNDPSDAARIQSALQEEGCAPAREIDLAEIRKWAVGVSGPSDLEVPPLPEVPDPSGETPESYGARLRVPPFDPRRESLGQHLFHLLWDDLPLLQRLLQRRLEHVGQWVAVSRSGSPLARRLAEGSASGAQLDTRVALLEEFCRSWAEGRGRPLDRAAIERSGAIRERYLDDVVEIARELGGDAEQLITLLRERSDPRLQGFRAKAAESLEAFLTEEGYLDRRPVLSEPEIAVRVMATPAAADLPDALAGACVHRWWRLCERGLAAEAPASADT
jgi:energy-coupling factor transporter ATP-binding protein EcfA2